MVRCRPLSTPATGLQPPLKHSHLLPTELVYDILTRALGDYLSGILLAPETVQDWDAISTLLHINQCFRCCTVKLLQYLWGGAFVESKTGLLINHKPTVSILRELSQVAHSSPLQLLQPPKNRLLTDRTTSAPVLPIVRMSKCFLLHVARSNVCASHNDLGLPTGLVEPRDDMSDFLKDYATFPAEVRRFLFCSVEDSIAENTVLWMRIITLRSIMETACRLRFFIDPRRFAQDDFLPHALSLANDELRAAATCKTTTASILCQIGRPATLLDHQDILPYSTFARDQFECLVSSLGELEKLGGTRAVVCQTWRAAMGRLLSERERAVWECRCAESLAELGIDKLSIDGAGTEEAGVGVEAAG